MCRIALIALCWCGLLSAEIRQLTILHTNDLHARLAPAPDGQGGFPSVATAIRKEREGCSGCILLNAGDMVQGSPVSTIFRGVPIFEIANLFAFDAMTLGNHEFDYGWRMIGQFVRKANYPIVSANIRDDKGRLVTGKPYVVLKAGGLRVAVLGAVTNDLPMLTTAQLRGPWYAAPIFESVRKYAAEARIKADLVVLLGHLNPREEQAMLDEVPEVDVVISGHSHRGIKEPIRSGERVAVRVRAYGEELGRLDLQVDTKARKIVSSNWRAIPISVSSHPPAPDLVRVVAKWENEVAKVVDVPIGRSLKRFSREEVKSLMERAMREKMGTDFALMNYGGVRDIIPEGVILARHVWNAMPFDNHVVVGRFTGSKLPANVFEGRTVDPDREYTLAVTDFTAETQIDPEGLGGTGYEFPQKGPLLRDLLIDWIKERGVLE